MNTVFKFVKLHFWTLLFLLVLLIGSVISVRIWKSKHPGSMTALESQAMDMTVMKPPTGAVPVATEIVHSGPFSATVSYTGSVAPLQEQVIYPRVEGYLKTLTIYNGDRVRSNELIATVDSPDLASKVAEAKAGRAAAASEVPAARLNENRMRAEYAASQGEIKSAKGEVARARAMVTAAQKTVTQREKEVKSTKAKLEYWDAEIAREEKLLNAGAVSVQEYQSEKAEATTAEAEYENAHAMLQEAQANVQAARAEVSTREAMVQTARERASAASAALAAAGYEVQQKAAMTRQARAMVETAAAINQYRLIRAPFAGTVTKRYVSPGQFVNQSTAVATVVQMDRVRLQVNVSDNDLGQVRVGAPVTARFSKDKNMVLKAQITSVSPQADQESRTAVVEAVVPNPGHRLVPGDAVTLEIEISGSPQAISIPRSAIVTKNGMDAVWTVITEAAAGTTEYYCTMHPEVVRDKPGKCPKCHMELVPRTSTGNKKAHLVMVTTGPASGNRMGVVSGLKEGDEVIYKGNNYLNEGDVVFPTKWGPNGPEQMPEAPGMGEMPGMDHGGGKMNDMPGMNMPPGNTGSPTPKPDAKEAKLYECPMHPQIKSDNPNDLCSICGMKINKPVGKK